MYLDVRLRRIFLSSLMEHLGLFPRSGVGTILQTLLRFDAPRMRSHAGAWERLSVPGFGWLALAASDAAFLRLIWQEAPHKDTFKCQLQEMLSRCTWMYLDVRLRRIFLSSLMEHL